jgi:3-hydroxymyristoyl/3-hydroxydecanoyl-(acyl carrier protein) dehydratase
MPRHSDSFSLKIFPSLLMVESIAQAAAAFHGVMLNASGQEEVVETGVLASVDKVRISGRPRPGDRLTIKVRRQKTFGPMVLIAGEVWVSHRLLCSAQVFVRRGTPEPGGGS